MEWLNQFVKETVELWTEKEHEEFPTIANYLKVINESKQLISKLIGDKGEDHIVELATQNGYTCYKTPRSWSDSDIFAFTEDLSGFCHLMLIQVKATETKDQPETLDADDIESLQNYSTFVLKRWFESDLVPSKYKGDSLILSCGYVGVVIKDEEKKLYSPETYQFFYHSSYKEIKDNIKDVVIGAHKL